MYMGGCQNYGPFLGTLNIRRRIIIGTQKGAVILRTTHMVSMGRTGVLMWLTGVRSILTKSPRPPKQCLQRIMGSAYVGMDLSRTGLPEGREAREFCGFIHCAYVELVKKVVSCRTSCADSSAAANR